MLRRIFGGFAYMSPDNSSVMVKIYESCILDWIQNWSPDETI